MELLTFYCHFPPVYQRIAIVKKSKIHESDTPQVFNCFKVESEAALLPS